MFCQECALLTAAFMIMSAIPDVMKVPMVLTLFGRLGYPEYLLPFLGTLKITGSIAILIPSFQRIKEWAYAGLVFDILGAMYSHVQVGDSMAELGPSIIALVLVCCSYVLLRLTATRKAL